jgi:cardiolipin synthase
LPLLPDNELEPLVGGDEAYPAMLRAIDGATRTIALSTYIFNRDRAGRPFIEALGRAVARGVEVRVLIDDFGSRHRWSSVIGPLRHAGVPVARFLPTLAPRWFPYLNLRNHRKILVVDGCVGFTGGMNILEDYLLGIRPRRPKRDLHFRMRGPAVASLWHVFAEDWAHTTGEDLCNDLWMPRGAGAGGMLARAVVDGPDDDRDPLLKVLLGALACARSRVAIATPYFLPDARLVSALETAALRDVQVDILLPGRNNHLLVQWASTAAVREVLEGRCRVWASPPPFDHTKLMVVDRAWSFIGSANWDARSLRLNFELNLECYSTDLAARLDGLFRDRLRDSAPLTLDRIDRRGLASRLRDGAARLFSPYL